MTGASVLLADNNPSFTALNLAEHRAQHSINSSNRSGDTSVTHQLLVLPSARDGSGNSGEFQLL